MTIDTIIDGILEREGSTFTNDPADAGGATRFGITLGDWAEYTNSPATAADIEALTEEQARWFYKTRYIEQPGFIKIADPWLQTFLVDTAVLQGRTTAIKMLQKCLGVPVDGVMGPITLAAISTRPAEPLKVALVKMRVMHLIGVALADIDQATINNTNMKWLRGWATRALSFL